MELPSSALEGKFQYLNQTIPPRGQQTVAEESVITIIDTINDKKLFETNLTDFSWIGRKQTRESFCDWNLLFCDLLRKLLVLT